MPPKIGKEKIANKTSRESRAIANQEDGRKGKAITPSRGGDVVQRTTIPWENATSVTPTKEGGMGGVIFVKIGGKKHVVKPIKGSAASAILGEEVLGQAGGAKTPKSEVIRKSDLEFERILDIITTGKNYVDIQKDQLTEQGNLTEAEQEKSANLGEQQQTWGQKMPFYASADFFLVQEAMPGSVFEKNIKQAQMGNVIDILDDDSLLQRIGQALAADTLIGNADRFENMNTGNAFITGGLQIGAIDTEAILQAKNAWLQEQIAREGVPSPMMGGDSYVEMLFSGGSKVSEDVPSSSIQSVVGNFHSWFSRVFKSTLEHHNPQDLLGYKYWDRVKQSMETGLKIGLTNMENMMGSDSYGNFKQRFNQLEEEYGADPNFSWLAFQLKMDLAMAVKAGIPSSRAVQIASQFLIYKTSDNLKLDEKLRQKIAIGYKNGAFNRSEVHILKGVLSTLSGAEQKSVRHLATQLMHNDPQYDMRLNSIRVAILKRLLEDLRQHDIAVAARRAVQLAKQLKSSPATSNTFLIRGSRERAANDLRGLGLDPGALLP